ncbi:MAG: adaptor protein MecA [Lachnospiraceae bacterium]|nr:adaptor protein MecA [Lachnospiraceae bacterium]
MKIEKLSEKQIRCTLTKNDLVSRDLKMSELAYGTEKARNLFKDMMREAYRRFGFEVEDIPLMIEAIPLSNDTIVLIITKVEDPEELDTRFSKFAPSLSETEPQETRKRKDPGSADDIIDLFRKLKDQVEEAQAALTTSDSGDTITTSRKIGTPESGTEKEVKITIQVDLTKLYSFDDLDNVIRVSKILKGIYNGDNTLYKNPENKRFYLLLRKSEHTPEVFNKVCNMITEYGQMEECSTAVEGRIKEHFEVIVPTYALEKLSII